MGDNKKSVTITVNGDVYRLGVGLMKEYRNKEVRDLMLLLLSLFWLWCTPVFHNIWSNYKINIRRTATSSDLA